MLLRLADNGALVTTPTLVAGTCSQQPLEGNGAAMVPLIKLIKKDQVCYSAAPSTTNQNATQGIYKGYKVARRVLIGIQY